MNSNAADQSDRVHAPLNLCEFNIKHIGCSISVARCRNLNDHGVKSKYFDTINHIFFCKKRIVIDIKSSDE